MRYLLAILLPPVAVLLCGKPFTALLNLPLTLLCWVPGVVHALFVVNSYFAEKNADKIARALRERR